MFVVALLIGAALRHRRTLVAGLSVVIAVALLYTFSRSSLLALAAGLVVLAFVTRRWWRSLSPSRRSPSVLRGCTHSRTSRRRESGRSGTSSSSGTSRTRIPARVAAPAASTSRRFTATGSACARACAPSLITRRDRNRQCGSDGVAHGDTDQGRRVELHGDRRGDRSRGRAALDGMGAGDAGRARARGAPHRLVGGCRRGGSVRRRSRSGRADRRHRRPVDGLRPLVSRGYLPGAGSFGHGCRSTREWTSGTFTSR